MNSVTSEFPKPTEKKRTRGRPTYTASVGADVLLRSARQTFAKQGFAASSVREIAREAGVDPALISHHFGSKDELWVAVVEQIAQQAAPVIEATCHLRSSHVGARERVEQAMRFFIDLVFDEPDVGMFFSTAATEEGKRLNTLIEHLVRPYHDVIVPLLIDAMKAKELNRNDPEVVFSMLMNAISTTVSYSHVLQAFSSLPDRRGDFKRAVLGTTLSMLGYL
ncbi:TetR/AcrR family transcriptional regulator [Paraburkholderia sediminicola]|uniref:TetR/AcrR family transcriptional regulator n=1 Tax=Paraburkholderia metrosideri TaxID=580937 RepID=A0ABW9DSV6_9BURK